MPKLQTFVIRFDNPSAVFYGCQWVTGKVFLSLSEPMKMRNVRVKFLGRAYCHWTESHSHTTGTGNNRRTHNETIHYEASEVYFDFSVVLWGKQLGDSGDSPTMAAGNFEFPIQFQLPINCPTSFEGSWGHIRYTVKATIDKPWKFDHDTKAAFTVIQLIDLNLDPAVQQPRQTTNSKTLGFLCCKAGNIECAVQMPRTGFVPGEVIPYTIQVNNESTSRKIKDIRVLFKQTVTFRANRRDGFVSVGVPMHNQKVQSKTLCEVRDEKDVEPNEHRTISTMEPGAEAMIIRVPPVPPMLATCGIISINYHLEFVCNPSGLSTDLTTTFPLVIGSIPLRQQFQYIQPAPPSPIAVQPSAPPVPMSDQYPDLPPPSYEECVGGKSNIRDETDNDYTQGDMQFAPRYTYYDWSRQPTVPIQS